MGSGSSVEASGKEQEASEPSPRVRFDLPDLGTPKDQIEEARSLSGPHSPAPTKRTHLYLSGRFNSDRKFWYIHKIRDLLVKNGVPTFICEPVPGKTLEEVTKDGLAAAKVMVAFCHEDYGERTLGGSSETFDELQYARDHKLKIIPVRLAETYPPQCYGEGRKQNEEILRESLVYIDGRGLSLEEVEAKIRLSWQKLRLDSGPQEPWRRHLLYLSSSNHKESQMRYVRKVKSLLDAQKVPCYICEAVPGEDVEECSLQALKATKVLVSFCFEGYGSSHDASYREVKYAHEKKLKLIPIKLGEFPPLADAAGQEQNALVFKASMDHVDGTVLDPYDVADEIQRRWLKLSQDSALPEDVGVKHLYLSGRFNSEHKCAYIRKLKELLDSSGIPCFVSPFEERVEAQGLSQAQALVALCFDDYGECTGSFDSYLELKYAYENNMKIIPIKLGHRYPPEPPDVKGRAQNAEIFKRILYIDGKKLDHREVVGEIRQMWQR